MAHQLIICVTFRLTFQHSSIPPVDSPYECPYLQPAVPNTCQAVCHAGVQRACAKRLLRCMNFAEAEKAAQCIGSTNLNALFCDAQTLTDKAFLKSIYREIAESGAHKSLLATKSRLGFPHSINIQATTKTDPS